MSTVSDRNKNKLVRAVRPVADNILTSVESTGCFRQRTSSISKKLLDSLGVDREPLDFFSETSNAFVKDKSFNDGEFMMSVLSSILLDSGVYHVADSSFSLFLQYVDKKQKKDASVEDAPVATAAKPTRRKRRTKEEMEADASVEAAPVAAAKPTRRKRRTKEEMEADASVEAAPVAAAKPTRRKRSASVVKIAVKKRHKTLPSSTNTKKDDFDDDGDFDFEEPSLDE